MSLVNIIPVEKSQNPIIETAVCINVVKVNLGVSALIDVQFLKADGGVAEVKVLTLEQPDYNYWGTDDQFVVNWTLQKLGLVKAPVVIPPPPPPPVESEATVGNALEPIIS